MMGLVLRKQKVFFVTLILLRGLMIEQTMERNDISVLLWQERKSWLLSILNGAGTFGSYQRERQIKVNNIGTTEKEQQAGEASTHQGSLLPNTPQQEMTDEEIHTAALCDPDNQPLTDEDFARMKRPPQAKTVRHSLQLTQEVFASRYHIPLGTLRDWEQERSEPDSTASAYLRAIAVMPDAVYQALQPTPVPS
jgi:putative transcriptional regulator